MSTKQDRTYTRTASDLERKYNFGQSFAEIYGLASDAQKVAEEAQSALDNLEEGLDSEGIFNRLTNYGELKGIYRVDGEIYVNASYIKSGKLAADYIDADNLRVKAANITGTLEADQIDATSIKVNAANIVGTLTAGQIDTTLLTVSAANIIGTLSASQIDTTDLSVSTANIYGALNTSNLYLNGLLNVSGYGYIGPTTASSSFGAGVAVCDTSCAYGLLAMTTGAKMIAYGDQVYVVSGGAGIAVGGIYYRYFSSAFYPSTTVTLGASSAPWGQIYSTNSAISTSDREKKNSIEYDIDERYDTLWSLLKPCTGKFNDGTSDRTHMFLISQDVEDAITEAGLTSKDFAAFIKSPKRDEDGNEVEGYDYALRYEEFIPLCIRQIQKLQARVAALEE